MNIIWTKLFRSFTENNYCETESFKVAAQDESVLRELSFDASPVKDPDSEYLVLEHLNSCGQIVAS